jgi:hypothetical protein
MQAEKHKLTKQIHLGKAVNEFPLTQSRNEKTQGHGRTRGAKQYITACLLALAPEFGLRTKKAAFLTFISRVRPWNAYRSLQHGKAYTNHIPFRLILSY